MSSHRDHLRQRAFAWAILVHRWLGVPLCLLFALWFASGAVMLFVPYPSLSTSARAAGSTAIEPATIKSSPRQALNAGREAGLATVRSARLIGQPQGARYVLQGITSSGDELVLSVDAATVERVPVLDAEQAAGVARTFRQTSGFPAIPSSLEGPFRHDQWTVHQRFDPFRPLFRVAFDDDDATVLYVSSKSGQVVQRTTSHQRLWNWLGSVPHWLYPTILRRDWALWDRLVRWLSILGILVAGLGLLLGVATLRRSGAHGFLGFTPFQGWLRWHHLFGLSFGLFLFTWILSGWLSMDGGRLFASSSPEPAQLRSYHAAPLSKALSELDVEHLRGLPPASEFVLTQLGPSPAVIVHSVDGREVFHLVDDKLEPRSPETPQLEQALRRAWPGYSARSSGAISASDLYGNLLEGPLPDSAVRFELDDPGRTWIHIDRETGEILGVMNRSRRIYRWLYNGLHSLDLPLLARHEVLRKSIILPLLLGGFALSLTGVALSVRRVRIVLARIIARRPAVADA